MSKKEEGLRRVRLGDVRRLLRHRHFRPGHKHLSDDDAGREDLYELLLPISLRDGSDRKMVKAIEVWAPWLSDSQQLIDRINRAPIHERKPTARTLGKRLRLLNQEREALAIRTIAPIDLTDEEMAEQRKAKDRARQERRRRKAGSKTREAYIANSLSKKRPWETEGISRRSWYRRRQNQAGTGPSAIKLPIVKDALVPSK